MQAGLGLKPPPMNMEISALKFHLLYQKKKVSKLLYEYSNLFIKEFLIPFSPSCIADETLKEHSHGILSYLDHQQN